MATYYVRTDGNDGNTGTANTAGGAWLTPVYAWSQVSDNDTIYLEEGVYLVGDGTTQGLFMNPAKIVDWIGVGDAILRSDATATFSTVYLRGNTKATTFTNITIDSNEQSTYGLYVHTDGGDKTFTDCTIMGNSSYDASINDDGCTFSNCTFSGTPGRSIYVTCATATIDECTFTSVPTSATIQLYNSSGGTYTITNNTVNSDQSTVFINLRSAGDCVVTDNIINVGRALYTEGAYTGNLNFSDNTITTNKNLANSVLTIYAGTWTATISGNTINCGALHDTKIFDISNQPPADIYNNTITTESTDPVSHVEIKSTGTAGAGANKIYNNSFSSKSTSGYSVLVGSDAGGDGNDDLNGAMIYGNVLHGARYYDSAATPSTHGIFVGHNINCVMKNNYVNGSGIGILFKHSGGTCTSGGIYNNVSINNYTYGIYVKGMNAVNVLNNTISSNVLSSSYGIAVLENDVGSHASANAVVKNNIIKGIGTGTNFKIISIDANSFAGGYDIDYNCLNNDISWYCVADGTGYTTIASWRTKLTDAANSINKEPRLDQKYVPRDNSPCKRTGINLAATYDDQLSKKYSFPDPDLVQQTVPWNMGSIEALSMAGGRRRRR
jgi:hypothetical protein